MDWGELQEWALEDATQRGCTCDDEPEVTLINCDTHGVHAQHTHEPGCYLTMVAHARWN